MSNTATIRSLNDLLRTTGSGGRLVLTSGIIAAASAEQVQKALARFDAFNADNDPYGEHDFGALDINGRRCFFKIDYYEQAMIAGSDDPSDPAKTTRVLTVMLASEY